MGTLSKQEEQYLKCLSKAEPGDFCEIFTIFKWSAYDDFLGFDDYYSEEPANWMSAHTKIVKVLDWYRNTDLRTLKIIRVPVLCHPGRLYSNFIGDPAKVLIKRIIKTPQKEAENAT
jgi:hypothetical protein